MKESYSFYFSRKIDTMEEGGELVQACIKKYKNDTVIIALATSATYKHEKGENREGCREHQNGGSTSTRDSDCIVAGERLFCGWTTRRRIRRSTAVRCPPSGHFFLGTPQKVDLTESHGPGWQGKTILPAVPLFIDNDQKYNGPPLSK